MARPPQRLSSRVGMVLWYWLLAVYPASRLGVLCFFLSVFGAIVGVLMQKENVEPHFILGAGLILAGIVLVSGGQWLAGRLPGKHKAIGSSPEQRRP